MSNFDFKIDKKITGKLGRAGVIKTANGEIQTPAFVVVGTKATVKALSPEQVASLGAEVVLANTYHLYLEPGDQILAKAGGFGKYMNWSGPTMTDSGGFQVFSLGVAYGKKISKITDSSKTEEVIDVEDKIPLAKIDEDGVNFKSPIDGSLHRFTPESSIEIQKNIGADIIFAFDECTSPLAGEEYQREAMDRTHRWAKRSLDHHKKIDSQSAIFGIVQGGRFPNLRKESAKIIGAMDFQGFGIGGSFNKEDMGSAVSWVNEVLPENKPRHLLGIGEPLDLFEAVENGCDTFDCVAPTRMGRNGTLYTKTGKINISNTKYREDFTPIDSGCGCYTCKNYTKSYLAHLFRAKEMFAGTLASVHNLYFIVNLVKGMRQAILDDKFEEYKKEFLSRYK